MVILGIDPGYAIVGWGVIGYENNHFKVLDYGAITTPAGMSFSRRLELIYDEAELLMKRYSPQAMSIEKLFFNSNAKTVIDVGQARGVLMLAAQKCGHLPCACERLAHGKIKGKGAEGSMIYSVTGTLIHMDATTAVVECGGVGFKCLTTLNTLKQLGPAGGKVTLYTYLNVREDALDLFGFFGETELACFKMLISVSGVGPKAALSILSELSPEKLALCIATGDSKSITRAQGVGPKLAQRVVLELKDKLAKGLPEQFSSPELEAAGAANAAGPAAEAVSALVMLGYAQSEASVAVGKLDSSLPVEELIKRALKVLARPL